MYRIMAIALGVVLAVCLWTGGSALAAGTWADEIVTAATFYKTSYPTGNWNPYFEELAKVKEGIGRGDEQIVNAEMDRFLKMLRGRAHDINDVAADELYNFALSVRPTKSPTVAMPNDLGNLKEIPMSVPDDTINMPNKGGRLCPLEGCDDSGG